LLGKTENYGIGDPWPIIVRGEAKPINSTKVEEYVNGEFYYYYRIYNNFKHTGAPYQCGFLDWPPWLVQLIVAFDEIIEYEKRYNYYSFLAQIHGYKVR
jgi:hypothetical protein